jgi:GTP-binding protein Era
MWCAGAWPTWMRTASGRACRRYRRAEQELIADQGPGAAAVLVINKMDTVRRKSCFLCAGLRRGARLFRHCAVSAKRGRGLPGCLPCWSRFARGGALFRGHGHRPAERQVWPNGAGKALLCLDKDIPHGTAVEVTRSPNGRRMIDLLVTLYCERKP